MKIKSFFFLLFFLGIFLFSLINVSAEIPNDITCGTYFSYKYCSNCKAVDPVILDEWTQKYDNLVIIEYFFDSWEHENAALLGQYSEKYDSIAGIPNVFTDGQSFVGRDGALRAEFAFKNDNQCTLLEEEISFADLDLNSIKGKPKFWSGDNVLISIVPDATTSNEFLKELLFSNNVSFFLENSNVDYEKVEPESIPIAFGEIDVKETYIVDDAWMLKIKGPSDVSNNNTNNNSNIINTIFGDINTEELSLPVITFLMGLADGFNPCAFVMLTLLLAAMIYSVAEAKSSSRRKRIAVVGFTFVFFSGLIYFIFMALWLNVFNFLEEITYLTLIAGAIAIFAGIVNIKDYFYFQKGISLTLPKEQKNKFTDKIKKLVKVKSFWALLIGTALIAATVNLYELLCTIGFPFVYIRILTLRELSTFSYYFYLILYNIFYILPLSVIVIVTTITLGAKQFSKKMVQRLKLISGLVILGFGLILVFATERISDIFLLFGIIIISIVLGLLIIYFKEFNKKEKDEVKEINSFIDNLDK